MAEIVIKKIDKTNPDFKSIFSKYVVVAKISGKWYFHSWADSYTEARQFYRFEPSCLVRISTNNDCIYFNLHKLFKDDP